MFIPSVSFFPRVSFSLTFQWLRPKDTGRRRAGGGEVSRTDRDSTATTTTATTPTTLRLDFPVNKSSRSAGRPRHFCHHCRRSRLPTTSSSSSLSSPRAASLFIPSRRQSRSEKRHPGCCQRVSPLRAFPASGS